MLNNYIKRVYIDDRINEIQLNGFYIKYNIHIFFITNAHAITNSRYIKVDNNILTAVTIAYDVDLALFTHEHIDEEKHYYEYSDLQMNLTDLCVEHIYLYKHCINLTGNIKLSIKMISRIPHGILLPHIIMNVPTKHFLTTNGVCGSILIGYNNRKEYKIQSIIYMSNDEVVYTIPSFFIKRVINEFDKCGLWNGICGFGAIFKPTKYTLSTSSNSTQYNGLLVVDDMNINYNKYSRITRMNIHTNDIILSINNINFNKNGLLLHKELNIMVDINFYIASQYIKDDEIILTVARNNIIKYISSTARPFDTYSLIPYKGDVIIVNDMKIAEVAINNFSLNFISMFYTYHKNQGKKYFDEIYRGVCITNLKGKKIDELYIIRKISKYQINSIQDLIKILNIYGYSSDGDKYKLNQTTHHVIVDKYTITSKTSTLMKINYLF